MKIVIPSKGRSRTIGRYSLKLFPGAIVAVDHRERDDYARLVPSDRLLLHPGQPELAGLGAIRQWILDQFRGETVVMADDDVSGLAFLVGWRTKVHRDPEVIRAVLENTEELARGTGAQLFGFRQQLDPRQFYPQQPFSLDHWVGGVIGNLNDGSLRYDPKLSLHDDIDLCLQSLLKHRVVAMDGRWSFVQQRERNSGGNSCFRSAERQKAECDYLLKKWGRYLEVKHVKTTHRLVVKVPRRQSLSIS